MDYASRNSVLTTQFAGANCREQGGNAPLNPYILEAKSTQKSKRTGSVGTRLQPVQC